MYTYIHAYIHIYKYRFLLIIKWAAFSNGKTQQMALTLKGIYKVVFKSHFARRSKGVLWLPARFSLIS